MSKSKVELLCLKAAQARVAYNDFRRKVDCLCDERVTEFRLKTSAELHASHGEKLQSLLDELQEADKAWQDAKVVEAIEKAPWPVGAKLVGWGLPENYRSYQAPKRPLQEMAEGILEVVTNDTQHPATMRYSRAGLGEYIVRLLKKNGQVGVAYDWLEGYRANYKWLPIGQTPKAKRSTG